MMRASFRSFAEVRDRVEDVIRLGGGEGYSVMTARFDGKLAVLVDQGTLADFLDEDDQVDAVLVHVFDDEAEREAFLASIARTINVTTR